MSGREQTIALLTMTEQPNARSDETSEKTNSVVLSSRNVGVLAITTMSKQFSAMFVAALKLTIATFATFASSMFAFTEKRRAVTLNVVITIFRMPASYVIEFNIST